MMLLDSSMAKIYGGQARRWARAWKRKATHWHNIAMAVIGKLTAQRRYEAQMVQRITELEEALRRIRDYATPGYRNMASVELILDGVFKAADDALSHDREAMQ